MPLDKSMPALRNCANKIRVIVPPSSMHLRFRSRLVHHSSVSHIVSALHVSILCPPRKLVVPRVRKRVSHRDPKSSFEMLSSIELCPKLPTTHHCPILAARTISPYPNTCFSPPAVRVRQGRSGWQTAIKYAVAKVLQNRPTGRSVVASQAECVLSMFCDVPGYRLQEEMIVDSPVKLPAAGDDHGGSDILRR